MDVGVKKSDYYSGKHTFNQVRILALSQKCYLILKFVPPKTEKELKLA